MAIEIKRIDIKEFREIGYLQEVNRKFLHPLGLALEVNIADDGTETLGGIWDYRDDPEGVVYVEGTIDDHEAYAKAERVAEQLCKMAESRIQKLGYVVQPIPGVSDAVRTAPKNPAD